MSRPITVQVGPLAASSATKISASQKANGAVALVLNGAAADASANNICTSQTPAGSGALTLDGSTVSGGVAYLPYTRRVYVTSAGDDSGRTFTIVGTRNVLSGPPVAVTETITGANASTSSTTKTFDTVTSVTISGAAAGAVTVGMNGLATLDTARRVLITCGGNDTGITFTVTGTDWAGSPISETITGVSGSTTYSVLDYLTVTSITTSGAVATVVSVGTNGVASSPWVRFDNYAAAAQVAIQLTVSGTVNYTLQQTLDDPNRTTNNVVTNTYQTARSSVAWVNSSDSNAVGATSTIQTNYSMVPVFSRVLLNSSTGSGYVTGTFVQAYTY